MENGSSLLLLVHLGRAGMTCDFKEKWSKIPLGVVIAPCWISLKV